MGKSNLLMHIFVNGRGTTYVWVKNVGNVPLPSQLFLIGIKVYRMILPKLELIYLNCAQAEEIKVIGREQIRLHNQIVCSKAKGKLVIGQRQGARSTYYAQKNLLAGSFRVTLSLLEREVLRMYYVVSHQEVFYPFWMLGSGQHPFHHQLSSIKRLILELKQMGVVQQFLLRSKL